MKIYACHIHGVAYTSILCNCVSDILILWILQFFKASSTSENQKQTYIEAGKQAKLKGLTAQYNLALTGLRMTIAQQRRIYEMKLNFEITSQMKDMTMMTSEFLKGMSSLSKDMMKLTKEKEFKKVQEQFSQAMTGVEIQAEHMSEFLEETQSSFETQTPGTEEEKQELDALMGNAAVADTSTDQMIEKELEELKRKMNAE